MEAARADARSRFALWSALGAGLVLIALNLTRWELIDLLTPFLEPFLVELPLHGLFLLVAVGSLVVLPGGLRHGRRWLALLPVAVCAAPVAAIVLIPFTEIVIDRDFHDHRAARERVVADIDAGTLRPNIAYNPTLIHLPDDYGRLSKGGNDIVLGRGRGAARHLFHLSRDSR